MVTRCQTTMMLQKGLSSIEKVENACHGTFAPFSTKLFLQGC